MNKVLGQ